MAIHGCQICPEAESATAEDIKLAKEPVSPITGDVNSVALWVGSMVLTCGCVGFVYNKKKR